ncbi:MAG: YraN family protein [Oscillospiraceae bacterium]|nr:YraN family protein [Oscillospiraceae bacterium]
MNTRQIGNLGETAVCRFLEKHGYRITARNFTCRSGEIDIIAENNDTIAFVEVKSRKPDSMVTDAEAVDTSKKRKIFRTAAQYSFRHPLMKQPRFDIAEITLINDKPYSIKYYKNAFDMSDSGIMLAMG